MYFGEITAKEETPHADQEEYQQELGLDCRRIGFIAAWLEPGRLRPVGRSDRNAIHPAARHSDDHTTIAMPVLQPFPRPQHSLSDGNRDSLARAARTDHTWQFQQSNAMAQWAMDDQRRPFFTGRRSRGGVLHRYLFLQYQYRRTEPVYRHSLDSETIAFSPDGKLLASGSRDGTLELWNVPDGTLTQKLEKNPREITSVTFSPDGRLLASASESNEIKLWNVSDGTLVRTLEDSGRSVAFSPDGKLLASGSFGGTINIWIVADGTLAHRLGGDAGDITGVNGVLAGRESGWPSGRRISRSGTSRIGRWHHTLEDFSKEFGLLTRRENPGLGSFDGKIKLWNVSDGKLARSIEGYTNYATNVTFSPDGKLLVSGTDF